MNEPQCQKKRVDWSEWASRTYGYECLARMKELAFSFWKATQNLITRTFHYLHFNNKKAFITAKSNETALKYLPILVLVFCVFVFSVCCGCGCVIRALSSPCLKYKENRCTEGREDNVRHLMTKYLQPAETAHSFLLADHLFSEC